jgi:hypothetical protein
MMFGANTGLAKTAIMKELSEAKERAWKAYSLPAALRSDRPSAKLLKAMKECMPKPSRPNE